MMKIHLDGKDIIAAFTLILGIYLVLKLSDDRYGFSLFILSLMYLVVRERGKISISTALSQSIALYEGALRVIKSLSLKGYGIFLPPRGGIKEDKIFIPLSKGGKGIPSIREDDVFNPGIFGGEMGVALTSPGKTIIEDLEKKGSLNISSISSGEAEGLVEPLMGAEGLFKKLRIFDRGKTVRVEIQGDLWIDACNKIISTYGDALNQYPCPPCSAVLSSIARVKRRPLQIKKVDKEDKKVVFLLEGVSME